MKKYGGFIPGIRAGRPTAEYLDYVLTRLTAAGLDLPGVHRGPAAARVRVHQPVGVVPVRRHEHPDHGRRRARHGEADRVPAAAAQLRRVPPLTRLVLLGPPGAGKGTQAKELAAGWACPRSRPATSSAPTWPAAPRSASRRRPTWTAATTSPTASPTRWSATGSPSPTPRRASCSTATPAPPTRWPSSTPCWPSAARPSTRCSRSSAPTEEVVRRLLQRAAEQGRSDDTEEVIRRRLEVYAEQTAPLAAAYRERGLLVRGRRHRRASPRSPPGCSPRSTALTVTSASASP